MPKFPENYKVIFALLVLITTIPTIILVVEEGSYEPFDLLIILVTAGLSFVSLVLLTRWLRRLIHYLEPDSHEKPHLGYPYRDRPKGPPIR